ncbi:MAG: NUDIX domain-containing protein [Crocinitomix sp.]|nr:NUDIX domain-containing protein [Crocinitomix sp.]
MDSVKNFNLRVYGLLINNNAVLVTDEQRGGFPMTKFPGGGLEKGEGLADGLKREFDEEISIAIAVNQFYYVNDFLQISSFNPADQLLSFYYMVSTNQISEIPIATVKRKIKDGEQVFRWVALSELSPDQFTFPIDKIVCEMLAARNGES